MPDPVNFSHDKAFITTRWFAEHTAAFGAEIDGKLIGSILATNWGSIGFLGPLTILPDFWDQGIGQQLIDPVMSLFEKWGSKHIGLFTFAGSPKHIGLYQRYGFRPRFLTAIMSKFTQRANNSSQWSKYSDLNKDDQNNCISTCYEMTDLIFKGLNLEHEIESVYTQGLGETVLIRDNDKLGGFAVCQCGQGTEAGTDTCYIKFGAVRPRPNSDKLFGHLLNACESLASEKGMSCLLAGINTARHQAYHKMLEWGFAIDTLGVIMQRPNEPAYNRNDIYLIDDWR